jgi:hypothetical protein
VSNIVPVGRGGDLIGYSPVADIGSQIARNYVQRGEHAAQLVVAALTETAGFAPVVGGQQFSLDVVEGPWRPKEETGPFPGIAEARDVLAGYVKARVPGADDIELTSLPTHYRQIAKDLWPDRRTDNAYVSAFDRALLEQAEHIGITGLSNAAQARGIIGRAPRKVVGLLLSERKRGAYGQESHDFVTIGGHMLNAYSETGSGGKPDYHLATSTGYLSSRGGRAPDEGIGRRISHRVTQLRSRSSSR